MLSSVVKLGGRCVVAVTLLLAGGTASWADYVAYADVDGQQKPLPEDIDNIEAKYLLNVKWGEYGGNQTRVGVLEVQNNSSASSVTVSGAGGSTTWSASSGGVPVQGIEAILTDVMHHTGRFRLVERKVLDQTLKEQDLGASGRISKPSAAKIGKVLGAEYLIQGVVTHYEPNYQGSNVGVGGFLGGTAGALLGGVGVKSSKSMVGMNFRLVDAETSEVIYTKQVESIIGESGLSFGGFGAGGSGGLGGFMSSYSRTPIGQAVIAAVNKGVYDLIKEVGTAPARGSVVKVSGSKVYLNLGEGRVSKGEMLKVMSKGEELIDPETGLSLGGEEEEIGKLEVTTVKDKFSIARPVGISASKIKKGSPVVSTRKPPQLQYGASWDEKKGGLFGGGSSKTSDDDF